MNAASPRVPVHFTYETIDEQDLHQGDILLPEDALRSLFAKVHPHFDHEKYTAFLVLTQTCDLVRRNNQPCKSRYINLAAVRPLRDVLFALLDRECGETLVCGTKLDGVYATDLKYKAKQLLSRILNQNAQAEGLFYLHKDAGVNIVEPSVALLQVREVDPILWTTERGVIVVE